MPSATSPKSGVRASQQNARSTSRGAASSRTRARSVSSSDGVLSRSSSRSSGSRSLTVNEREIIINRDEMCLFCGVSVGTQVAHIMARTRQVDPEIDWMRKFMAQTNFSKRHSQNLMLLCPTHHSMYDNGCFTITPTEKNLAYLIAFEERDFERREAVLTGSTRTVLPDRRVPSFEDLEPLVEIIWIHGAVARLQFGDHYLQVLNGDNVPQSISWMPTNHDTDGQKRKLQFFPSPYGYQALLDISHAELPQFGGHRLSPYALLARSLSTIVRATFPVNDRIDHIVRMILHLRALYNRIPRRHWVSHNPWTTPPSLEPSPPPQNFSTITLSSLEGHPCWERGLPLAPLAPAGRGSAVMRNGPRSALVQSRRARSNSSNQLDQTKNVPASGQPDANQLARRPRPDRLFGEAISAATQDAKSRAPQGVAAPSRRFPQQVNATPQAEHQSREGSPMSTDRTTTEYDSSKDPLDVISIPDMSKLTISEKGKSSIKTSHSTERSRTIASLSRHPATSQRVGGSSAATAGPKSRGGLSSESRKFVAPPLRAPNPLAPPKAQVIATRAQDVAKSVDGGENSI